MVRRCIREGTFPGEARGEVGSVKIADFVLKQFLHSRTRAECRNPRMLKDAKNTADKMVSDAKEKAKAEYDKILADAQSAIQQQKNAVLTDLKNQAGALIIEVAEKVLRQELNDKTKQENYIKQLTDEIKLN